MTVPSGANVLNFTHAAVTAMTHRTTVAQRPAKSAFSPPQFPINACFYRRMP